jgi:hypothetical protein
MIGGVSNGGASTGGVSNGGTGGVSNGGASTGGVSIGGTSSDGTSTGGASTGGVSKGGVSASGAATGVSTGGASTGGVSKGGAVTPAATVVMAVARAASKKIATITFLFIISFTSFESLFEILHLNKSYYFLVQRLIITLCSNKMLVSKLEIFWVCFELHSSIYCHILRKSRLVCLWKKRERLLFSFFE